VRAQLDRGSYPTGVQISEEQMRAPSIVRDELHGAWNYVLRHRPKS
jgi:hypothetical protein